MRGVNETGEGVCLCTTDSHRPPPFLQPPPNRDPRVLPLHTSPRSSRGSFSSSSGGFVIFLHLGYLLLALHPPRSTLYVFVGRGGASPRSARGSTAFRGVNRVDAGANSLHFALFFQKIVYARERAISPPIQERTWLDDHESPSVLAA